MDRAERERRREYFWQTLMSACAGLLITFEEAEAAMKRADGESNWGWSPPGLPENPQCPRPRDSEK